VQCFVKVLESHLSNIKLGQIPMPRIHPEIRLRAQEFRQPQTPAERIIWQLLRSRQVDGYKFRRQHPIGNFIVDFCCPTAKLVIEIDGDTHTEQVEYDQSGTDWLENEGYYVIRFSNQEVYQSPVRIVEQILKQCQSHL
jgi:very-short-patch-repair endonuclease